ncbi:hypothetical protein [Caulobacter sp. UNC279MFTsu5.1]|uniref:hypothetical protein n=1 Tax=Caulobacter sp. UNC279MFTsu5.1 TaxID=1502775 RepID=UPI0008EFFA4B|nr:hypothetical protein [Caulobacter sp. UNC279MFTsu5.1]SFJ95529.1 hypothetical protein SAMN02799626_03009 [Caulobacter sp. UNC279MFTsu5.1]
MSLDAAVFNERPIADEFSGAFASDPAASILKHAVKIWARDHGVAENDLTRVTEMVVGFAKSAIRDCERKIHVVA